MGDFILKKYNYKFNFHFILFIIALIKNIYTHVQFDLYTYRTQFPETFYRSDFCHYFKDNTLYTYLTLGTPSQTIVAILMPNEFPFSIYNNLCEIPSDFNIDISKTYTAKDNKYVLTDIYVQTYIVKDNFEFSVSDDKKVNVKNIQYLFSPTNNTGDLRVVHKNFTCAKIGLKLAVKNEVKSFQYNFIKNLKDSELINNYAFFILYDKTNDTKGKMFIGVEPHEYDNKIFKEFQLKSINALNRETDLYWDLKFDKIYFNISNNETIYMTESFNAGMDFSLGVIGTTYEFGEKILKNFFKQKIKEKKCERRYIVDCQYESFDCESEEDIKDFPDINFEHKGLMYTFRLTYKDLFVKLNDRYVCLLWIDNRIRKYWTLGKPFLKKYFFSYNYDKKVISFYNKNINEDGTYTDKDDPNYKENNKIIYQNISTKKKIIILFLLLILALIGFFVSKRIYMKNKQKATELNEDNYFSNTQPTIKDNSKTEMFTQLGI